MPILPMLPDPPIADVANMHASPKQWPCATVTGGTGGSWKYGYISKEVLKFEMCWDMSYNKIIYTYIYVYCSKFQLWFQVFVCVLFAYNFHLHTTKPAQVVTICRILYGAFIWQTCILPFFVKQKFLKMLPHLVWWGQLETSRYWLNWSPESRVAE